MLNYDTNCYHFEKIIFDKGLFDNCVDATYIIHLEGNGRYDDIMQQLTKYQPTKITYILFNKGFKKCKKKNYVKLPGHDLVDAFLKIFKDADNKNYNNILILEDDFFFTDKIYDVSTRKSICEFLNSKKNENYQYLLGCVPLIQMPYSLDLKHYTSLVSLGTHAVIYSKKNRKILLEEKQTNIKDWDIYNWKNSTRYIYVEPLCYQLFLETENAKNWGSENLLMYILGRITMFVFNYFKLDKQIEPGYPFFYIFSKIILFFIIFSIILFLILFLTRIIPNKFTKNNKWFLTYK